MNHRWIAVLEALTPWQRFWARMMRLGFGPMAALVVVIQAEQVMEPRRYEARADEAVAAARQALGVTLIWRLDKAEPAPMRKYAGIPIVLRQASPRDAANALTAVNQALAVFPDGFADRLLSAVYITDTLRLGAQSAGGMAAGSAIYVEAGQSAAYTRRVVFHETATVLLRHYVADPAAWAQAWRENNAPGFRYAADWGADPGYVGDAPLTAVRSSWEFDPALFGSGLLSAYGQASVRADVDTYADAMFTQPEALRGWMGQNERIRRKVMQLQYVYLHADPHFEGVFARLGLPELAP